MIEKLRLALCVGVCATLPFVFTATATVTAAAGAAYSAEYNPVRSHPVAIGPEAGRLIVGFRATGANAVAKTVTNRRQAQSYTVVQARTTAADVSGLAQRVGLAMTKSRQITPSMHVVFLQRTLYGAAVEATLAKLRADPSVEFAAIDARRYPHTVPNDPLFLPIAPSQTGQWYLNTPNPSATVGGVQTMDLSATDAVSAWAVTTGSSGTVIADVDTGVRFDHPDLLRAGFGGRLLPGYDFVGQDYNPTTGAALGTYLVANDGDGWDPDPSDPGDWINATDQAKSLFPTSNCTVQDSSWHGTRVVGILGALTNNSVGIAGMTWNPYILPVRALGKCGGYDSDIIAGVEWAAGMSVTGVPDNPYPADIINLSLGGSGACTDTVNNANPYLTELPKIIALGVLVVASAGNGGAGVDTPASCPGVLAVAGLRNVGTKVGYSSFGAEVGIAAPAGNCINSSGPCLRTIDTTSNSGLTVPAANIYTDQTNVNLGTSFSAPIVSGIAALMRAVNANLTPAQLIARIEASATQFPQPATLIASGYICPASDPTTGECACPNDGMQCGAGMVNALAAVNAALRPIAAVVVPANTAAGSTAVLDAGGTAASCGRTVASYAWAPSGAVTIQSGAASAQVTVVPTGISGILTLTVTDTAGAVDTAILAVSASGAITAAPTTPTTAGTSTSACPTSLTVTPAAPTVSAAFSPASVGENVVSTLTITLTNANGFALTQSNLTETLPANVSMATATSATPLAPAMTCVGAAGALTSTSNTVTLTGATIPAKGSCTITIPVQSTAPGSYTNTLAANALTTGPAGANSVAATATLTVTAPSKSGGGALDWWDTLFAVGVLLAGRRHAKSRPPHP